MRIRFHLTTARLYLQHPWAIPMAVVAYTAIKEWVFWALFLMGVTLDWLGHRSASMVALVLAIVAISIKLGALTERLGLTGPFRNKR